MRPPSDETVIETKNLRLRNWRFEDRALFHEHCNTVDVMRWLGGKRLSKKAVNADIDWFEQKQRTFGTTFWAAEQKSDGEFLGFCGLVVLEKDDDAVPAQFVGDLEIGWRLRSDFWGRGFAKEAAIATLDYAFGELRASQVVSRTEHGNADSWGLMRRLGMRHEFSRDYGPAGDHRTVVYVIDWRDWLSPRP